jgi:hypothetical protein
VYGHPAAHSGLGQRGGDLRHDVVGNRNQHADRAAGQLREGHRFHAASQERCPRLGPLEVAAGDRRDGLPALGEQPAERLADPAGPRDSDRRRRLDFVSGHDVL